jgi:hypothetical protein
MRVAKGYVALAVIVTAIAVVYAGDGFSMKCKAKNCGYQVDVTFGGGMATEQLLGYCRECKKFVTLQWTREGSPTVDPNAKKIAPPKALGEIWDSRTGNVLKIYTCPHCAGPFAEIKSKDELKNCPKCCTPGFAVDDSKPRMAVD